MDGREAGAGTGAPRCALTSDDDPSEAWGTALRVEGLFAPLEGPDTGGRTVRLLGCAPRGALAAAVDGVGGRRARAGNAYLALLDRQGDEMGSYFVNDVTVTAVGPSRCGGDLLDLTVSLWCESALPESGEVWTLIRDGRVDRPGMWRSLGPTGRRAWLSVALLSRAYRHRERPEDASAGEVFVLDGGQVVDEDSFYCALGEAVNGPGGYFGWNLPALDDCLRGRWGATAPFTLRWRESGVAQSRLGRPLGSGDAEGGGIAGEDRVEGCSVGLAGSMGSMSPMDSPDGDVHREARRGAGLFEVVLEILRERGVTVDLR